MKRITAICFVLLLVSLPLRAATIHVPADFSKIQLAIDAATNGDTVLVEPGRYYENISFLGKKIIVASRYLTTGNTTYIDSTIIDGSHPVKPDTASVVLFVNGEDTSSVIEGFTLTGGAGTVWKDLHNFGLYREGGAVLSELSSPTIRNNYIYGNSAVNTTGVVSAGGGGIRSSDGFPRILNNYITGNSGRYGGGIVLNYTGAIIRNNVVYKNTGGEDYGGSGIWAYNIGPGPILIENNTVVDNVSALDGGGLSISSTTATIHNNIIWGNSAATAPQISRSSASLTVTYCDVQGGWSGTGNINAAPAFRDTSHYLTPSSPCVDAGDPVPSFNDREDTLHPGSPAWPSQGGLRDDMGAFGGPAAAATIYIDLHLNDPLPPGNFSAYSDFLTQASVTLRWSDPLLLKNGMPANNFKIHIFRDSLFVAEVDSGVRIFLDTGRTLHQFYTYNARTVVPNDSGVFITAGCFAGGSAVPAPPVSFTASDGTDGAHLRWVNPSRQADGTPLNDLGAILIYRDGLKTDSLLQTAADSGQVRGYIDTARGYHSYMIRTRDTENPAHVSAVTDSVVAYAQLTTTDFEDYETGIRFMYRSGTWDSTGRIAFSGKQCLASNQSARTPRNSFNYISMPSVILTTDMTLRFHDIAIVNPDVEYAFVEISTDHRKTFKSLASLNWDSYAPWSDGHADSTDWRAESISLAAYKNDTITIRFRLIATNGPTGEGWYIDSMAIYPTYPPAAFTYHPDSTWNLLALPVTPPSFAKTVLFPTASSPAFRFTDGYSISDTLTFGTGFWIKFPTTDTIPINGTTEKRDTVILRPGWNLIGGLSNPIDTSAIQQFPAGIISTGYYRYQNGYVATSTLAPGVGYWVKAKGAGSLALTSPANQGIIPCRSAKIDPDRFHHLTITDRAGHRQILGFGLHANTTPGQEYYEMPPLPPENAFDVRFADHVQTEIFRDLPSAGASLLTRGVDYPLTIRWDMNAREDGIWQLIADSSASSLRRSGSLTLTHPAEILKIVFLGKGSTAVPASYGLEQNFPNPFNPTTIIRYELPGEEVRGTASIYNVSLRVYNILGQPVATLVDGVESPGFKSVVFDGTPFSSGVYYYRLQAGSFSATKKLLIVK
jgi:hypothetical protein